MKEEEEYKIALKAHYQYLKEHGIIIELGQANLRKVFNEKIHRSPNILDESAVVNFFDGNLRMDNLNKLEQYNDKFKTIANFLNNKTINPKYEVLEITAIIIDFENRPFKKFRYELKINSNAHLEDNAGDEMIGSKNGSLEQIESDPQIKTNPLEEQAVTKTSNTTTVNEKPVEQRTFVEQGLRKSFLNVLKKNYNPLFFVVVIGYLIYLNYSNDTQCMRWNGREYEKTDCKTEVNSFASTHEVIPFNNYKSELKLVIPNDKTIFFKHGKPVIWYIKKDKKVICYNRPGEDPETGKALKPITKYMVGRYFSKQ